MKEKTCRKCNATKPVSEFYRIMNKDRHQHVCIECMVAKRKKTVEQKSSEYGRKAFIRFATYDLTGRDY